MTIHDFFEKFPLDIRRSADLETEWTFADPRPWVYCRDGFKMSVQASTTHYSAPRTCLGRGAQHQYTAVEIGFPSTQEPLIDEYADTGAGSDHTQTVFGYVPVALVDQVLEKHGGIDIVATRLAELNSLFEREKFAKDVKTNKGTRSNYTSC